MIVGTPLSKHSAFLFVFAIALAVRLLFVFVGLPLLAHGALGLHSVPGMRFDGYHDIAVQIVEGRGFSLPRDQGATAARAPLYPVFLASLYRLFGPRTSVVLVAHAVLGALTAGLTLLLGWRLYGRAVGILAGLVPAVHPSLLWWSQYVLSETLLTLVLTLAAFGLAGLGRRWTSASALLAGALLGLAVLCNSVSLLFPLVLIVAVTLWDGRGRVARVRAGLLVAAAMAVLVLPWTARNAVRFHALVPVNWGVGFQAYKGWIYLDHVRAHGTNNLGVLDDEADRAALAALRARGYAHGSFQEQLLDLRHTMTFPRLEDDVLARLAAERLRRDPLGAVQKTLVNLWLYWTLSIRRMEAVIAVNLILLALALVGVAATAGRDPARWLTLGFAAYLYLFYSAVLVSARFSVQVIPVVSVFAAAGAVWLASRARSGGARSAAGG